MWATTVFDFLSMLASQAFTRKDQLCSKYLMDFQVQSSKHFQSLPPDQFQKCMNPKTKQKQNNKKGYESCCERFISKMAPLLVPVFCIIYLCCCYDLKINKQKQKKKPTTDKRGLRKEWSIFFHTALEYSLSDIIEIRSWGREPHCGDNQYTKEMNAQS